MESAADAGSETSDIVAVLTAKQVAGEVSIGWKAVLKYLRELKDEGVLKRMKVGARVVVWWPGEEE